MFRLSYEPLKTEFSMMKRTLLRAVIVGMLTALWICQAACTDDEWEKTRPVVEEGKPVTVSLNFSVDEATDVRVVTRSDTTYSSIGRLRIWVYDAQGNFLQMLNWTGNAAKDDIVLKNTVSGADRRTYTATFRTTTGERKLLLVANAGAAYWKAPTTEELLGNTYERMTHYILSMRDDLFHTESANKVDGLDEIPPMYPAGTSGILLSGAKGCKGDRLFFTSGGTMVDEKGEEETIELERTMARVTFKIPVKPENGDATFTPLSYKVYNVPKRSYVSNVGDYSMLAQEGVDEKDLFCHFATDYIGLPTDGAYSFEFFMPENIYSPKDSVNDYTERDKWSSVAGTLPEQKQWTHAPQRSTFVVIKGIYSGKATVDGSETTVEADVEYTIHLGDFSADNQSKHPQNLYGDFSVKRNWHYTYNVQVLGVNNIIVEATTGKSDGEKQPGAEGHVFDNTDSNFIFDLDAHYEQVYLEYNLSEIAKNVEQVPGTGPDDEKLDKSIGSQLRLIIQSEAMEHTADGVTNKRGVLEPYTIYADAVRGKTDEEAKSAAQKEKEDILEGGELVNGKPVKGFDYKWIEFLPQSEENQIATYPGISDWAKELADEDGKNYYGTPSNDEKRQQLMDVYDIIVEMGKAVKKIVNKETRDITTNTNTPGGIIIIPKDNGEYVARFTAFVNEYFYLKHPLGGKNDSPHHWSLFTDKQPRRMMIATESHVSADGNSIFSKVYSSISQRSIQTFYDDRTKLFTAFGMETYSETPRMVFGNPKGNVSGDEAKVFGLQNQRTLIGLDNSNADVNWVTFVNFSKIGWTKHALDNRREEHVLDEAAFTAKAYAACLSRNRDLNGDGKITANEVRWYLPSINEYIRVGLTSRSFSLDAQLYWGNVASIAKRSDYNPDTFDPDGGRYFTSSPGNASVYWAIERVSNGKYNNNSNLHIRCARLLPKETMTAVTEKPESNFQRHDKTETSPIVLDFRDRMLAGLYRERISTGTFHPHSQDHPANRYYQAIYVADGYLDANPGFATEKEKFVFKDLIGLGKSDLYNPCANYTEKGITGWRLPNMVELSAMYAAGLLTGAGSETIRDFSSVASCTQFPNTNVRYGFVCSAGGLGCFGGAENDKDRKMKIRCVKDVDDGWLKANPSTSTRQKTTAP